MAIKNSVPNNFLSTFVDSINVFDSHLSGVNMLMSFLPESTWGQCQRSTLILKLVLIHFCVFGNFAWFLSSVDIFFSK